MFNDRFFIASSGRRVGGGRSGQEKLGGEAAGGHFAAQAPVAAKELVLAGPGQRGHTVADGLDGARLRRERAGRRCAAAGLRAAEGPGNR